MLDLLREQEKTSFPSRESSFSGWEQSAVSSNLIATIRVSDNFGNQTNVTSSCSIALQTNLRNGLFVFNSPINWVDPDGRIALPAVAGVAALVVAGGIHAYQIANAASQMAPGESAYLQTPLTVAMNVASGVGDAAAITFGPNGSEGMWVVHIWVDSCGKTHHEWVIIPQFTGA